MSVMLGQEKPDLESLVVHFGVKGMRWGVVRQRVQQNHALNKASRAKDRANARATAARERDAHNKAIDSARARLNSGEINRDFKTAKSQFKTDKKTIGSREARKRFREVTDRLNNEIDTAHAVKNGSEAAVAIINAIGQKSLNDFIIGRL